MQKVGMGAILTIAVMATAVSALGAIIASKTISNTGNLKAIGVGVYWDSACTNAVSSIDWGSLDPGVTRQFTIYVKNEGTVTLKLSMTVNNWSPASASNYITLSWNRENHVLSIGSVVSATLTLSVSSGISGIT
ncbi:MAG: hypothetical protein HXY34_14035, partial [Candidatus Thorarchaeota archaeon]|nr:hypothetical protein [Candidatus Thorarchaeota archaeon]